MNPGFIGGVTGLFDWIESKSEVDFSTPIRTGWEWEEKDSSLDICNYRYLSERGEISVNGNQRSLFVSGASGKGGTCLQIGDRGRRKLGPDTVSFDQNAGSAVNDAITEATFLDVLLDGLVLGAGLEP